MPAHPLHAPYTVSRLSLAMVALVSVAILVCYKWVHPTASPLNVIDGDGRDYYSYLVSLFIRHDLGHQDVSQLYITATPTGTVNVHTIGVSLLLLPFFAIAYLWAQLFHYAPDGFSEPFQKMVSIGALFYMLAGLAFIRRLLIDLQIRDQVIGLILFSVFIGTNILNYGLNEPSMSHIYSFACIAAFLYYSRRVICAYEPKYLYRAALAFGLILLVRPVNGIVLFTVPMWASSFAQFVASLKQIVGKPRQWLTAVCITVGVAFLQSAMWLYQNGRWLQWTQKDDGFYFLDPHPWAMLFGFNAGFFVYVPLCFFMLFGLVMLYKRSAYQFSVLVLFLVGMIYLFSSHWAYTYFDGLGIRPMVDYYALFALLGALWLNDLKLPAKVASSLAIAACVVINLVYCYQYKEEILPPSSMNYNKLSYIFMKTDPGYAHVLGGCMDVAPYTKHKPAVSYSYSTNFSADKKGVHEFDTASEYGVDYRVPKLGFRSNKLYVTVSLKRKEAEINSSSGALVAFQVESPEKETKNFQAFKLNDAPSGTCCEWEQYHYAIILSGDFLPQDSLTVFLWNKNKQVFSVDDLQIDIYNYNREI